MLVQALASQNEAGVEVETGDGQTFALSPTPMIRAKFTLCHTKRSNGTHKVPAGGKKIIEYVTKQLVVEIKAETIRVLDRSANTDHEAAEPAPTEAP